MTVKELREKYLKFFKERGHAIIPSASLIPENDPSVLFTTAGMHPLVPYLLGEKHPAGKRLVDVQKCIRTSDIEDVGDYRHLTFFEMLGNWSLGEYFKKEAIAWSWEFLTDKKQLGLDPKRLYITVFKGDENAPIDQESIDIWQEQFAKVGMKAEICDYNQSISGNENYRIFSLPAKDNWWGPAGQTGPCGPCSEMFYDLTPEKGSLEKTFDEEVEAGRIMEIWNDVFMEFEKRIKNQELGIRNEDNVIEYEFVKLGQKNVDTGMGLERTVSVLNGKLDAFDNELFWPIFEKIEKLSGERYSESAEIARAVRIVADHLKAVTFILGDDKGIVPSNVDQGYVVRRLIRRAVRYGKQLGIENIFTFKIAEVVIDIYQDIYPELRRNKNFIINQFTREEEKFSETLERGLRQFEKIVSQGNISGKEAFDLYQTYGFPVEMTTELAGEKNIPVDKKEFFEELKKHQELSRAGAEQKFKGGLADYSEQVVKYHTAAHLMLAALRRVLGEQVVQRGSNITAERLRFDFSYGQKMTSEEIKKTEEIVNEKIAADLPVKMEEMSLKEAKVQGAVGVFESRYGERVKVYIIADRSGEAFSREICGGPHVERTGVLGNFRIAKEESSSAGVRRIKAILD